MRVYLVRHPRTTWNAAGRAQGHSDVPLDEIGLRQAEAVGTALEASGLTRVLSSDLSRCALCAEAIASITGAAIELEPRLRERSLGAWEGLLFEEIRARRLADTTATAGDEAHAFETRPPGGETLQEVWERLHPVAERLFRVGDPVAVVSHGGSTALLLAQLLHGSLRTARAFRFDNASITELQRRYDGLFQIGRLNDTAHLRFVEETAAADATSK